jgi:hypothetical protein
MNACIGYIVFGGVNHFSSHNLVMAVGLEPAWFKAKLTRKTCHQNEDKVQSSAGFHIVNKPQTQRWH